jgi:L-arabinonolactonase
MRSQYDAQAAWVGAPEVFAVIDSPAEPDGAAVDCDGRVWSAQWGAGEIVCLGSSGVVECRIAVPASNPSCLAFCGPALDQVLVTTARDGLGEDGWRTQPHAGGVFRASTTGAAGLPESRFDDR